MAPTQYRELMETGITGMTGKIVAKAKQRPSSTGSANIKTRGGCTCQFPFKYAGKEHNRCMYMPQLPINAQYPDVLWCDTGNSCGHKYTAHDKKFTDRSCCYDICVDSSGKMMRASTHEHDAN